MLTQDNLLDSRLLQLREQFRQKLTTSKVKINSVFHTYDFAAGVFGDRGGYLWIPNTSISLFIPPDAIKSGEEAQMYIYLEASKDDDEQQDALLSPVVRCGPEGLNFKCPLILTIPHCVENMKNWQFCVTTKSGLGKWQDITENGFHFIGSRTAKFSIDHFCKYALRGSSRSGDRPAEKKMVMCTFGSPFQDGNDEYTFRVRAWQNTPALEAVSSYSFYSCVFYYCIIVEVRWFRIVFAKSKLVTTFGILADALITSDEIHCFSHYYSYP